MRPSEIGLAEYDTTDFALRRKTAHAIILEAKYLGLARRDEIAACVASKAGPLPDNLMSTSSHLQLLHAQGVEIGGHTVSHPVLTRFSSEQAQEQIQHGKATGGGSESVTSFGLISG